MDCEPRLAKCKKCKMPKLFYLWMDKELSPAQIVRIKRYIAKSKRCCGHMEFERNLRAVLKKNAGPVRMPVKLKAMIRKKMARG